VAGGRRGGGGGPDVDGDERRASGPGGCRRATTSTTSHRGVTGKRAAAIANRNRKQLTYSDEQKLRLGLRRGERKTTPVDSRLGV